MEPALIPCPLATARFLVAAENKIKQLGLRLACHTDFEALNQACDRADGKDATSEPFSRLFMDIPPADGMWISGTDYDDRVVHLQAMRFDRLTGITLADFWKQQFRRIHVDPNPGSALNGRSAPPARRITGDCVYHGEMWVKKELRGRGLGGLLSQFALALALARWNPDYVWGFVSDALARKGFPFTEGYRMSIPKVSAGRVRRKTSGPMIAWYGTAARI